MNRGVVLYGPPAAGKDAITAALCARSRRFVPQGSATGRRGEIPVVHADTVAGVAALGAGQWIPVLLWAPRDVVRLRCERRGDADPAAAVAGWERCYADLVAHPDAPWAVAVRTDGVDEQRAAEIIERTTGEAHTPAMRTVLLHRYLFR